MARKRPFLSPISISSSRTRNGGVPEVIGRVAVCNENNGHGGVVLDGVDAVAAGAVVFGGVCGEGLEEGFAAILLDSDRVIDSDTREKSVHQIRILRLKNV